MAKFFPSQLPTGSTHGERRVAHVLHQALLDTPEATVWFDPPRLAKNLTDYVLWLPSHGLFVMEVKDYSRPWICDLDADRWFIIDAAGIKLERRNPAAQAKESMYALMRDLAKRPLLRSPEGKLVPTVNHVAIFPNLSKEDARACGALDTLEIGGCVLLFQEDLEIAEASIEGSGRFIGKVVAGSTFTRPFALSNEAVADLHQAMFPVGRPTEINDREISITGSSPTAAPKPIFSANPIAFASTFSVGSLQGSTGKKDTSTLEQLEPSRLPAVRAVLKPAVRETFAVARPSFRTVMLGTGALSVVLALSAAYLLLAAQPRTPAPILEHPTLTTERGSDRRGAFTALHWSANGFASAQLDGKQVSLTGTEILREKGTHVHKLVAFDAAGGSLATTVRSETRRRPVKRKATAAATAQQSDPTNEEE